LSCEKFFPGHLQNPKSNLIERSRQEPTGAKIKKEKNKSTVSEASKLHEKGCIRSLQIVGANQFELLKSSGTALRSNNKKALSLLNNTLLLPLMKGCFLSHKYQGKPPNGTNFKSCCCNVYFMGYKLQWIQNG